MMLDQSFSSINFNLIFLKENRKGNFKKSHFTDEYINKHKEFNDTLQQKVDLKKQNGSLTKEELNDFALKLDKINTEKEEIRLATFDNLSKKINEKLFQFNIEYNVTKKVYTLDSDAASFYAIKQLQTNINKTFKVIQADRNYIIKQLYNILSDGFPKVIIKTDIKSFYESIPQVKLFEKINDNTLLSPFSKKLIKKLFHEFESKKDTNIIEPKKGIPRGIGVSAYLSELYMRDVDRDIKSMQDIIYYARYVDDIIVIFSPKTESSKGKYIDEIKKIICDDNLLMIKDGSDGDESKTFEIDLPNNIHIKKSFNFLGYKFEMERPQKEHFNLILEISDNKLERYKKRLKLSVEAYNKDSVYNEKKLETYCMKGLNFSQVIFT